MIFVLLVAISPLAASAQDKQGRVRQPPPSNPPPSNPPSGGGSSGGSSGGASQRPSSPPPSSGGGDRSGSGGGGWSGGAVRRTPPVDRSVPVGQRPGQGTVDAIRGRNGEPKPPTQGPSGESLGHAVRRDSLPPRTETVIIGGLGDPRTRHGGERERNRYYWHEYQGRRYSHYVDPYGDDWYFWYSGNNSYSMRYYDGRWWRHDPFNDRWCYMHNNYWYYQHGGRNYVYDEDRNTYEDSEPITAHEGLSVGINVGSFSPGARGESDVIARNAGFLTFNEKELNNFFIGGEVSKGVGNNVEVGVDAGYYKGTTNSNYTDYVRPNGAEIKQQLSVTMVPVTATVKAFPWGRDKKVQPYVGAGVGVTKWKYQEGGEFIDFAADGYPVYSENYSAGGTAVTPVAIAGLRVPLNNRVAIGGEYRRTWGAGSLAPEAGFSGDKIGVGGNSLRANVTVNIGKK